MALSHLPRKLGRDQLAQRLREVGLQGDFDFLYMPMDLKNRCSVGHAVVNFRSEEACKRFTKAFNKVTVKHAFPGLNVTGGKACEVVPAPVQGRDANVRKLQQSVLLLSLLVERPEWLPQVYDEEGLSANIPEDSNGASSG